jgi:hypothetical protein
LALLKARREEDAQRDATRLRAQAQRIRTALTVSRQVDREFERLQAQAQAAERSSEPMVVLQSDPASSSSSSPPYHAETSVSDNENHDNASFFASLGLNRDALLRARRMRGETRRAMLVSLSLFSLSLSLSPSLSFSLLPLSLSVSLSSSLSIYLSI